MEFVDYIPCPQIENVVFVDKSDDKKHGSVLQGTLCVTGHHVIMSSRQNPHLEICLLHRNIDVIEKKMNNQSAGGNLVLKCKDFRIFQINVNSTEDLNNTALSLEKLSSLDQTMLYPFYYKPQTSSQKIFSEDGWFAYIPVSEWSRLLATQASEWRISYLNREYKVCKSYPSVVIVPRQIEDDVIISSASFRDGGRFPVLCYRHDNGSVMLRSSQPMCGVTGKRCREDEKLLNSVLGGGKRGYIIDTRSVTLAQSCKAKGGGTELESSYPQWRKVHKAIIRTCDLLDSLGKLIEACNDTNCSTSQWLSRLDNSGWLSGVQNALDAACVTSQCLHQDLVAVLIHGGRGRDSTLVVTSLSQVILNPDCRTVRGLQALIEREWLQAGHPFSTRTSHCAYYASCSQGSASAPTFLLFLDCLFQLVGQFQFSFEYTTELLKELFKNAYASNFATFLGDSEETRFQLKLAEKTCSLWTHMNEPQVLEKFLNPLYEPNAGVIWPSVAPASIQLWRELYLAHTNAAPWDGFQKCLKELKWNYTTVKKIAGQLRSQVKCSLEALEKTEKSAKNENESSPSK